MKLVSLELSGFRGFPKKETFDLDADCVVLVGANGCGKTSILDSILWALTGSVSRLGGDRTVVRSKYSLSGETQVSLRLRDEKTKDEVSVTRSLDGDGGLQVAVNAGGRIVRGPAAEGRLAELLWPEASSKSDSASALASVIASSVYLEQDLVRSFITSTSDEDRFKTVGELVGAGRVTDLQLRLEKAKLAWTRATNQLQEELDQLKEQAHGLDGQLSNLLERRGSRNDPRHEAEWSDWWKAVERFGVKTSSGGFAAKDAPTRLDSAMKQLVSVERSAERRIQALQRVEEDLQEIAAQPSMDTRPLIERVEIARKAVAEQKSLVEAEQARMAQIRSVQIGLKERSEQLRALAQIALKVIDEECPVCGQAHDRDATTKRLKKIIASKDEVPKTTLGSESLPRLLAVLTTREKELSEAQTVLRDAEESVKSLRALEHGVARRMKDLGFEGTRGHAERLKAVAEALKEIGQQVAASNAHRESGEVLSVYLSQATDQGRIAELKREIAKLKEQISEREEQHQDRSATGELGQRFVEALRSAASDVVMRRLEQIGPLLRAVYSRIDPHPAFKAVGFLSKIAYRRGRLNTVITDAHAKIESSEPGTILSSSQMNALAVSVFLSLNLGAHPPLSTVVLDDPLQSLDDVNLLGLVDLLRRTKGLRQLLVSTHDERFGNLLARKLRPGTSNERTVLIRLGDWKRDGPVVLERSREVKGDAKPLRLVAS